MNAVRLPGLMLIGLLALSACTQNRLIRDQPAVSDPATCKYSDSIDEKCQKYSIEDHAAYLLSIVEFDEQGWFRDRRQQTLLMRKLDSLGQKDDVIVIVFVHGWKHNAEFCDSNMCCFRDTLEQLARIEQAYNPGRPRKIVGVYVGWRGLSLQGADLWENLSFYDRKTTATQVALGSTRELFDRLFAFQRKQNDPAAPPGKQAQRRTRLMLLGHSFGGLIVYSAIAQSLLNSAIPDGEEDKSRVAAFGDLVVLVNPAMEGTRYEGVYSVLQSRTSYSINQPPVFVAVTSADDDATRLAFPVGRTLGSLFNTYSGSSESTTDNYRFTEPDQKQADRRTIGHVIRYRTHELVADPPTAAAAPKAVKTAACTCPYKEAIGAIGKVDLAEEAARRREFAAQTDELGRLKYNWTRRYHGAKLIHEQGNPDSPYWVVTTHAPIIPNHNEFFTPLFLNFLRELYDDVLTRAPPAY